MSRSTRDHTREQAIFDACATGLTLSAVGKQFGLGKERVRQIRNLVLRDQERARQAPEEARRRQLLEEACLSGRPYGPIAIEFGLAISEARDLQERLLRERAEREAVTRG